MLASLQTVDSIVVRCPNWVGDIVMATPVFDCLRKNFPTQKLIACVRPYARGILEDAPWFDDIVDCQDKTLAGLRQVRGSLRTLQPDAGILLTNTTHSWLTFKYAGIPRIYGYRRNLRRFFLTDGPAPVMEGNRFKPMPMQAYYLDLCRYLGLEIAGSPKPALYISAELKARRDRLLASHGIEASDRVIGLNPGASFGSSKCWPAEYFSRLGEMLQEAFSCKLLLLVGPGEEELASKIVQECSASIVNTADDRIDLALLKPLIQRCDLLITNDTGPRHYAVAFDIPHIVVIGPTNPIYTASNLDSATVLRRDLPCAPCHRKVCPLGHHACMNEITPQMVFDRVRQRFAGLAA